MELSSSAATELVGLESSVCALLALDLEQNGLFSGPLDKTLWHQSMNPQGLRSNMWLLAYESDLKGWLSGQPRDFVEKDVYFKELKKKNISFYDINKNVTRIEKQMPKRRSAAFLKYLHLFGDSESMSSEYPDVSYTPY